MTRRQYPLRPAYASSTNGGQGRTLFRCVLDTRHQPFSHGHLYVAVNRVCHRSHLRVVAAPDRASPNGRCLVRNVVWPELLIGNAANRSASVQFKSICYLFPSVQTDARVRVFAKKRRRRRRRCCRPHILYYRSSENMRKRPAAAISSR